MFSFTVQQVVIRFMSLFIHMNKHSSFTPRLMTASFEALPVLSLQLNEAVNDMDRITFTVNGEQHSVGCEVSSDVTLLDYLRNTLELRGTKYMCREGGCGACIVLAARGEGDELHTVNSCLVSITSCQGWSITTTEEVGNRLKGYSSVQRSLADHNGTQCGYCSPAWVMSMTSLLKKKGSDLTMLDVEKSFASNTCRCTGYRPIMEAFKTFAKDAPNQKKIADIEDLTICKSNRKDCKKDSCSSTEWCFVSDMGIAEDARIEIKLKDDKVWYKVYTEQDIFYGIAQAGDKSYMLVAGNTGKGVYPILEYPEVLIDISDVASLQGYHLGSNLTLNAGNTLSKTMDIFEMCAGHEGFGYLNTLHKHIEQVAHPAVRNIGTIAGNLMLKHKHNDFPSDIFVLFETVGAVITIHDSKGNRQQMIPSDFLSTEMKNNLIISIELPPLSDKCLFVTYKIMPRAQNAVARVNAAFLYKMDNNLKINQASIVFGNINPRFIHASNTEDYLKGRNIFQNETLQEALKILEAELIPEDYQEITKKAKKRLALGLFYKGLLELCPSDQIDAQYRSGATSFNVTRPVSKGRQIFDSNPPLYPLTKPMPKSEALIQCAGEAPYVDDSPNMGHEVFASFVISTVPVGEIENIDSSAALNLDGVIAFFTVKDIPGLNSFTPLNTFFNTAHEEELCDGHVKFNGQPIGIIVAETRALAEKAAKVVNITYKNVKKPILDIKAAMKYPERIVLDTTITPTDKGDDIRSVVKGSNYIYGQFHYCMETQTCNTKPIEDSIEVLSATQWLDQVQLAIQECLNIDDNAIDQRIRRLGGAFGSKLSRANQIAIACTLVTLKLNRPCRMIIPLTTNTKSIGKRLPNYSDFEAGVNSEGKIQYLKYNMYVDNGYMINEPFIKIGVPAVGNSYDKSRWDFKDYNAITDTAKNSWMRAPGTFDHIAMTEYIMEQICYELSLDPVAVRQQNLVQDESMKNVIDAILKEGDYKQRRESVKKFNSENRWKKRGLRFVPLLWPVPLGAYFNVTVVIYHSDGTVVITHGGVEMGQGINTKAAQVCAYALGVPFDKVKVKATNNHSNPNGMCTGGSYSSEMICLGVQKCCDILNNRLAAIKVLVGSLPSYVDLIASAFGLNTDLFASYNVTVNDQKPYNVYGATLVEAEVDILTGESQILRVDLLEDVGQSINPEIDVGQIEGGFIMGQGYWTCEELVYDEDTGELLTDRTWNYHVPQARDIPLDFRVYFHKNSYNTMGFRGSKATGEPSTCMSICVPFAIREAISASRVDSGIPTTNWFSIDGPYTVDKIVLATATELSEFVFK